MNDKNENWPNDSIAFSARTDVGMRRSNNQDSYCVSPASTPRLWRSRGHLFVVADGMGAHAAGELASQLATSIVSQSYLKRTDERPSDALRDAILEAHKTIQQRGRSDEAFHDMGTTCDALALTSEGAYVGHVGDSRVYRLRNRVFEQITFDHSLVWEVKHYPDAHAQYRRLDAIPKNVITRSLGPTERLEVDLEGPFPTQPGDVFLLCSDGLSGQFEDAEIGQILELFQPEEATEALINFANLRGGSDNITVVVARVKANPKFEDEERYIEKKDKIYEKRPPITAAAWAVLGLSCATLIAALIVVLTKRFDHMGVIVGLISFLSSLACGSLFCYLARKTLFASDKKEIPQERLGKGPYTRVSAIPNAQFTEKVEDVCAQLCDAVRAQPVFEPDWDGVEKARKAAIESLEKKDFAASLRANISVVNYIMRELRKIKGRNKA